MKFSDYLRDRFSAAGQARLRVQQTAPSDTTRSVTLEYQRDQYRVFHLLSGGLVHSHPVKAEAIRRALRDGFVFEVVA